MNSIWRVTTWGLRGLSDPGRAASLDQPNKQALKVLFACSIALTALVIAVSRWSAARIGAVLPFEAMGEPVASVLYVIVYAFFLAIFILYFSISLFLLIRIFGVSLTLYDLLVRISLSTFALAVFYTVSFPIAVLIATIFGDGAVKFRDFILGIPVMAFLGCLINFFARSSLKRFYGYAVLSFVSLGAAVGLSYLSSELMKFIIGSMSK